MLPVLLAAGALLALVALVLATAGVAKAYGTQTWASPALAELSQPSGSAGTARLASNAPRFQQVDAGNAHTCGVQTDGRVVCWGSDSLGQATPPEGTFQQVSAGYEHTCGVRTDRRVACWGWNEDWFGNVAGQATPPEGTFHQVSAAEIHTCGVRTDGQVACWGDDSSGQATPPEGTFQQVSAGGNHTCGVRTDARVACWGNNGNGEATPPDGTFQQVSAAGGVTCGVRTDDRVACWGADFYGQATPPGGTFQQVSAGGNHTCGVRTDGRVACWGADFYGQATPPEGTFQQVSVGNSYTCGVQTGSRIVCWGSDFAGRATPPQVMGGSDNYDADDDGLIEVSNLVQLDAIRYDLDGDGAVDDSANANAYAAAFPDAVANMGCPTTGCTGYELTADLDFDTSGNGQADAGDEYWNGGEGWRPIGVSDARFTAMFDGDGHTIRNLYIKSSSSSCSGLFGYADGSAHIRRVGLTSVRVEISGRRNYPQCVGGLVGYNSALVTHSYVIGRVSTTTTTGGSGNAYAIVGGLVGNNNDGVITDSYAIGSVSSSNRHYTIVGGLVGRNDFTITDSYATGSVSSGGLNVGGLVGSNFGEITDSYAKGSVSGDSDVGGLAGDSVGIIRASYAISVVNSNDNVGGLVGGMYGSDASISQSYASANVSRKGNAGGLVGYVGTGYFETDKSKISRRGSGTITSSFWNENYGLTTGVGKGRATGGAVGKTTDELRSPTNSNPGIYASWDGAVWDFGTSSHYPKLWHVGPIYRSDYDADDDGLIEVSNLVQLDAIRYDLDGNGAVATFWDYTWHYLTYAQAFPNATEGMGCPSSGCIGYELAANLDFDTDGNGLIDSGDAYWNGGSGWVPIGDGASSDHFTATFDGGGYTIANLYVNRSSSYVGLVGVVGNSAIIRRVGLVSSSVSGDRFVGSLAGNNSGAIADSYATGSVTGSSDNVGGLVGYSTGTITGSYATATVTGYGDIGGLVGENFGVIVIGGNSGAIVSSYSSGTVSGHRDVGGLVGENSGNGAITDSYATGNVTRHAGGGDGVGGLVGGNHGGSNSITHSYATGRVAGSGNDAGGLVGYNGDGYGDTGQLTSTGAGAIVNSYWDTQTSGRTASAGGVGKTTDELKSPTGNSGIYRTWDATVWDFGNQDEYPTLRNVGTGDTQPPTPPEDYDADDDGLIEVSNLAQLDAIRYDLDGDGDVADQDYVAYTQAFSNSVAGMGCPDAGCTGYELAANLDFDTNGNGQADAGDTYWNGGAGWLPIGADYLGSFAAIFDGGGHTIANLYIDQNDAVAIPNLHVDRSDAVAIGLFWITDVDAVIRHVGLIDAKVSGAADGQSVGGLVGFNSFGALVANYVTGDVSATGDNASVGGLVGYSWGGSVSASYAAADVSGTGSNALVGGLVGMLNQGDITSGYATGSVTGDDASVGGLVGHNRSGTITTSYAIGKVTGNSVISTGALVGMNLGTLTDSYWNTETSGQDSAAGGTSFGAAGKTTAEMQSPTNDNPGIYATWDAAVWDFGGSDQYPKLKNVGSSAKDSLDPVVAFARDPDKDFVGLSPASAGSAEGIWSDGSTMWVADINNKKLYAYSMTTWVRVPDKDFDTLNAAGNVYLEGIWSDGVTMWVADDNDKLYAYDMTTKAHIPNSDFNTLSAAGNNGPEGIWSDGKTMWVADHNGYADATDGDKLYAYDMATKARVPSKDFDTLNAAGNNWPIGIWSDGITMWVSDWDDDKLYAYDMATKARVPSKDFNTLIAAGNNAPEGIWSDGTTMWVRDDADSMIYAYHMPPSSGQVITAVEDYDTDDDSLIEVSNLAQLDAIRYDLDGDGAVDLSYDSGSYAAAFPNAVANMGCPTAGCVGYELIAALDFDTNGNGQADAGDTYWNGGAGWLPIGADYLGSFAAIFDGGGHTIANLYIDQNDAVAIPNLHVDRSDAVAIGLFWITDVDAVIRHVGLIDAKVSGAADGQSVGGLVGFNSFGALVANYVTGDVSATGDNASVGGLVGYSWGGSVSASYAAASVSGTGSNAVVGGLVGMLNQGDITSGYATGSVTGDDASVGGLVGHNRSGTITDTYATGRVTGNSVISTGGLVGMNLGTIIASYWNTETSRQDSAAGGTSFGAAGKTTAEMQSPTNSNPDIYATWDAAVWDFGTSRQYPMLRNAGVDDGETPTILLSAPHLYWVDEEAQKIQRIVGEDDEQSVADLATSAQGLNMPGSIALDPLAGKMYWTDDGTPGEPDGAIRRANLDGSNVENLFSGLPDPVGIALDLDAGKLYWAERGYGMILRVNLDGSGIEVLIDKLHKPYQIALDTANGHIYWTERGEEDGRSKIRRADLDGEKVTDINFEYPLVAPENPFGLTLDPLAGKMYWTERGTGLNGGDQIRRANLDGQNGEVVITSAYHSLSGIAVDVAAGKIYWTDEAEGGIRRANLDGSEPEDVVSGLSAPEGVAMAAASHPDWLPLVALYHDANGQSWTNSENWLTNAPIGDWPGVTTDDTGRVQKIILSGNNLAGHIPEELGSLANLETLSLRRNRLSGGIPSELRNLGNLGWLNLEHNDLTGQIPDWLGGLTKLRGVGLGHNRLNGEIPVALGKLNNLTHLYLAENDLGPKVDPTTGYTFAGGKIPKELGNLGKLEVLILSGNRLTGPIPPELGSLANLTRLNLGDNELSGWITPELGSLDNLTDLKLNDNQLTGPIPPALGNLTELKVLDLSSNRLDSGAVKGGIPSKLGDLTNLQELDLSHNQLTRQIPTALGNLRGLRELNLSHNQLFGTIPSELGGLLTVRASLRNLNLSHNYLDREIPVELGRLINLETLDISHNSLAGAIPKSLGNLVNLEFMYIHANPSLSGCVPRYLEGVQGLEIALNDHQGNRLDGFCLSSGAASDKSVLEILYSQTGGDNWYVKGRWMTKEPISTWHGVTTNGDGRVTALDLGGNNLDGPLPLELRDLTELRSLDLRGNRLSGSITWLSHLSNLEYLDLSNNQLSGQFPVRLSNLTQLREVRLQGNDLDGWIPAQLVELVPQPDGTGGKLEKMFLHNNGFTGCVPIGLEGPLDAAEKERRESAVEAFWRKEISLGEHPYDDNTISQWMTVFSSIEIDDSFGVEDVAIAAMKKAQVHSVPAERLLRHFIRPSYGLGLPPCAPSAPAPEGWVPAHEQNYGTDRAALLSMCKLEVQNGADCPWSEEEMKKPLQEWHGVHTEYFQVGGGENWEDCGDTKDNCRVTRLVLVGKNWRGQPTERRLTGEMPPELGNLGELKVLNLSKNNLYGEIPPELGNLRNLYSLALNDNNLKGAIPATLGHLGGRLDDLSIFSGLDNLLDLHLQKNRLTGEIPQELSNVGYLRTVRVDPQIDATGKEYELEGCLHASEALDVVKSLQIGAFNYVYGKITGAIDSETKKSLRNTKPHQDSRSLAQGRVVEEVNDYRGTKGWDELDEFQKAQVEYAAGLRFDAQMDEAYSELSKSSGFSDALTEVKERFGEWLKDKALDLGGAGDFEDVACNQE